MQITNTFWVEYKELGDMRFPVTRKVSGQVWAFVLVAKTTTGPDSKLHLTAIPCSKVAYLE